MSPRTRWASAAPPALVSLIAGGLWWPASFWPVSTLDEAILLVYPQRMASGDLPYRDFFAAYGPAYWWGLRGWYGISGISLTSMRVLGLVFHLGLVLGVYALASRHGRTVATASGVLATLLLFRLGGNPYAWLASGGMCLWQLWLLPRRPALGGVLGGLAIAVRPDVALMAVVPASLLALGVRRRWLAGVGIGLLPVVVSLIITPGGLIEDVLLGRAGRGAAQSRLPLLPIAAGPRETLAMLLAAVAALALCAWRLRERSATASALLAVLALPQAFQRADETHFVFAGLFSLCFLPVAVFVLLGRPQATSARARHLWLLVAAAAFVVSVPEVPRNIVDMTVHGKMRHVALVHDGRRLWEAPVRARVLRELLGDLDRVVRPGDTVFVFDSNLVRPAVNDVSLYWYLRQLRQRAFNMEITPGITNQPGSRLVQDLMGARWVILVDTPERERRALFPYAKDGSREARNALQQHFCPRIVLDRFRVWERCA